MEPNTLTKEQLAAMITGREYNAELTKDEEQRAKEAGLVVVCGASDDLMELRGAIYDEADVYDGGMVYLDENGLFKSECDDDGCPYAERERKKCKTIEAIWCDEMSGIAWTYLTHIPHAIFDIMDEGDIYCKGIVFHVDELKVKVPND